MIAYIILHYANILDATYVWK